MASVHATGDNKKRLLGLGRKKIPILKIANPSRLNTCFSKRRRGLFRTAAELSVLTGTEVAVLAFSPAGRPYSFGSSPVVGLLTPFLAERYCHSPESDRNHPEEILPLKDIMPPAYGSFLDSIGDLRMVVYGSTPVEKRTADEGFGSGPS